MGLLLMMLLALMFRGVAFEFRYRDAEHRTFWDHAFNYGSVVGAFAQGVVLGAFIQGFQTEGRHFSGGSFDCFTPFSLLTGVALVIGYGLLGAGWLILVKRQLLVAQLAMLLEKRAAQDQLSRQPLSPDLLSATPAQILRDQPDQLAMLVQQL